MQTLGLSDSTPRVKSRLKDLLRPDLSNDIAARTVCETAAWACFIIAGLGAVLSFFLPSASLVDAAMFVLIGLGLRKAWRTAAITGFLLYIAEQVVYVVGGHVPSVLAIIITIILFNSIRASFAYQRLRRLHQPPPIPAQPGA